MSGFRFKQFEIQHDRCAMKVGTDGILLGAWADITQAKRILDLGTGTGLIALMLAQRTADDVQISAVEIDPNAVEQAKENILRSPWGERISVYQQDVASFCEEKKCGEKFDLIVANPPYFEPALNCKSQERNLARYATQSHLDWLNWAANCLTEQGKIQFILPFEQAKILVKSTALSSTISCEKFCSVQTKSTKTPQRALVSFQKSPCETQFSELVIYDEHNQYTDEFVGLTRAFYLKME